MIRYPYLQEQPSTRLTTEVFRGLNLNERVGEGEFAYMEGLTSDHYPVLSPRRKYGKIQELTYEDAGVSNENVDDGFIVGNLKPVTDGMFYVSGVGNFLCWNGKLFLYDGWSFQEVASGLELSGKSFALMGTRLVITPDMKYLDVRHPEKGLTELGARMEKTSGAIGLMLCDREGNPYNGYTPSGTAPDESLSNGALWLDTSQQTPCLKQYTQSTQQWITIPTTYLMIHGLEGHPFAEGDGVEITGMIQSELNGSHVIVHATSNEIVITGITDNFDTQMCEEHPLTVERKVPQLSFLVEAGNRLWGCNATTNEIYASRLGDCTNWNVFSGLSTDSWVGNVGSPGPFTGAVNQGGYPVFYKQDIRHKVWPSATGAHQITSAACMGVAKGCDRSLAQHNGRLFYLSPEGVCMDDGSGPVMIGQSFAGRKCFDGAAACYQGKYYISMHVDLLGPGLYVYDPARGLWHRERYGDYVQVTEGEEGLYLLEQDMDTHILWDASGTDGEPEPAVSWSARTGDLMLSAPDHQYISRLTLRLSLEPESRVDIYARYDQEEHWEKLGTAYGSNPGIFTLPVRPRRCDHLRLRLDGQGMGKVYAITRTLEKGSELS